MKGVISTKRIPVVQLMAMGACVLLSLMMWACTSTTATSSQQDKPLIAEEAKKALEPYKHVTKEDLAKNHQPSVGDDQTEVFEQWGIDPYEMCALVLSTYDYQIDETIVDGDNATVKVTVRFVDVAAAMQRAMASGNDEASISSFGEQYRSDNGNGTVQLVYKQLLDAIANEKGRTSSEITLLAHKVDGTWFMDTSSLDAIVSAAFGTIA